MDKDKIHSIIAETQPNICQVAVFRNNGKIFSDEWNGYHSDDCTHIMSATKSIMALLLGIAIDQGNILSIDEKVLSYFPEYQVKRGEKTIRDVTIRHLITMRAPYKCKGDPWSKVCSSEMRRCCRMSRIWSRLSKRVVDHTSAGSVASLRTFSARALAPTVSRGRT